MLRLALIFWLCLLSCGAECRRAHQGHRDAAGRARQSARRLWSCRRLAEHRRHAAQLHLHPAGAAVDARPAGRQRAQRQQYAHAQRRRGSRHCRSAALRHAGNAHRRQRVFARRRDFADGRHVDLDLIDRRRRPDLRHCARASECLGLFGRGPGAKRHAKCADGGAHSQWRARRAGSSRPISTTSAR